MEWLGRDGRDGIEQGRSNEVGQNGMDLHKGMRRIDHLEYGSYRCILPHQASSVIDIGVGDRSQGLAHVKQTFYQPSFSLSLGIHFFVCLLSVFRQGHVVQLWPRTYCVDQLPSNPQRSTCPCLSRAGKKGMHHHTCPQIFFL